jgi:fumarate reductase subunit C
MVELHVSIGFYRIGVKWGFIKRENRNDAVKLENLLFIVFVSIGLFTLARFWFLAA